MSSNRSQWPKGVTGNPLGRPKGPRTIKVIVNDMFEDALERLSEGTNPLDVIHEIMDNPDTSPRLRLAAATELCRYIVPALPRELNVKVESFQVNMTREEALERLDQLKLELQQKPAIDAVFEEALNEPSA